MKKVFFLRSIANAVRQRLIAENKIDNKTDHSLLAKAVIGEDASQEQVNELAIKITTYTKSFEKELKMNSSPVNIFFRFCQALDCVPPRNKESNSLKFLQLTLELLKDKQIISNADYLSQLAKLNLQDEGNDYDVYACYYSTGVGAPELAVLKIDRKKWESAFLEFLDEPSILTGVVRKGTGTNVFIQLTDDSSKFLSLITLKGTKTGQVENLQKFNGTYCSALASEDGKPVAGKLVVIKKKTEKEIREAYNDFNKRDVLPELVTGRLKFDDSPILKNVLNRYVGVYEAYWFLVKRNLELRQIKLQINPDASISFMDPKRTNFKGAVLQCDEKVLKLGIDPSPQGDNFRSQWIFDLTSTSDFIDGVYSGQRQFWGKIMGGKMRLYKSSKSYEELDSFASDFKEARTRLSEYRIEQLENLFWGSDESLKSNVFIQPTISTVRNLYRSEASLEIEDLNQVKAYQGFYTLYRLDSSMERINRYNLEITEKGIVKYTLNSGDIAEYEGTVLFRDNCLLFKIAKKRGKPYNALYILYVGSRKSQKFSCTSGVYSTIASDASPICGRVVLQKSSPAANHKPIEIDSEEYFSAENEDKKILALLTGDENNLIKSRREINSVKRKFNYGEIYFSYASNGNLELSERVFYIKGAFEHGFRDVFRLKEQLRKSPTLQPLENDIKIQERGENWFCIEIDFRGYEDWSYNVKVKDIPRQPS